MHTTRRRILYVEDDADACELLTTLFSSRGYEVATARSVSVAERMAREGGYDLYILDGRYPDGTGVALCERIRRFDAHTPVLFFSGLAQDDDREQARAAGAQAYLVKPNDFARLAATVTQLLETSGATAHTSPPYTEHRIENRVNTLRRRTSMPLPDTQREDLSAAG